MKGKRLIISMNYEPNRLAKSHLSDAYEKLIMTIKYQTNFKNKDDLDLLKKLDKKIQLEI